VPLKGGALAKSRLATALSQADRERLAHDMARHVLTQLVQSPLIAAVWAITPAASMAKIARQLGVHVLKDRECRGTTIACQQALTALRARGLATPGRRVLFIGGDLLHLNADALTTLLTSRTDAAIAPDEKRRGTNALLVDASRPVALSFGPHSFQRHLRAARRAGIDLTIVEHPALAFDIDEPADLARLREWADRHRMAR
jgi:2-phospho-L-lactate guanylyltransferase